MASMIRRRCWQLVTIVMICFVVMIVHRLSGDRELYERVNDIGRVWIRDQDASFDREFTSPPSSEEPRHQQRTTVATNDAPLACKVPVVDPFHPLVKTHIEDLGTDLSKRCRSMNPRPPAFNVIENKLVLRPQQSKVDISRDSIKLEEIDRDGGDFEITYTAAENPFKGTNSIRESNEISGDKDFFRLYYDINGTQMSDLYARIASKINILAQQKKIAKDFADQGIPLNVLIIGFDTTSRANFERKMGGVISFLKTRMTTYFMKGMSIIGDGTTPALTAMLTGKYVTEVPEGRRAFGGKTVDDWPWIMKEYEKRGYMTLFAEDEPGLGAFNLRLKGFRDSPVHHYMRPFWLSLEREGEVEEALCSKSESLTNITLKYIENFFDAYAKSRKFAFAFFSYLTHDLWNHLSYAEADLLCFLRSFVNKGYQKDTMVVIMGDHGPRRSKFRATLHGKLEERLPWFSVSVPASFHRRFPDLAANLRSNQAIISSPFDLHATLRHILTYPKLPSDEHTKSLFTKLPRNRTCKDAGISEHLCPCLESSPVNVTSEQVRKVALAVVDHMNKELSKFAVLKTSCHPLILDSIQDAVALQANTQVLRTARDVTTGYQIIFTTKPNDGIYEATVSVSASDGAVKGNPEISRTNTYGDQPKCIAKEYPHARRFCFCKT